jgi:hypothetical protein
MKTPISLRGEPKRSAAAGLRTFDHVDGKPGLLQGGKRLAGTRGEILWLDRRPFSTPDPRPLNLLLSGHGNIFPEILKSLRKLRK